MDLSKMTEKELTERMKEAEAVIEAVELEKTKRKTKQFNTLVSEIIEKFNVLRKEFPHAKCMIEVATYSGPETINILENSDLIEWEEECFRIT